LAQGGVGIHAPHPMQQQQEQEGEQHQQHMESGSFFRFRVSTSDGFSYEFSNNDRNRPNIGSYDWARAQVGLESVPLALRDHLLPGLLEPLPEEVRAQLRCLRWSLVLSSMFSTAVVGVQFWCMCDAVHLLWHEDFGEKCQLLRWWLISYCLAVVTLPCCAAFSVPLLACCIMMGKMIRARSLDDCQHRAAGSCAFADAVMLRTLVSLTLVPISTALSCFVQQRLQVLRTRWGQVGPALEEIINFIAASPPPEVPPGTECSICLSDDTALLADWRELRCGHQFHMECLRGWLERERRCPICRSDLHTAYLAESSSSGATSAFALPTVSVR